MTSHTHGVDVGASPDARSVTFLFPKQATHAFEIQSSGHSYHPHCSSIQSICAVSDSDGYRLYTGSRDACVNVFHAGSGGLDSSVRHVASLQGHVDWVNDVIALDRSANGLIGTCSSDGTCRVWKQDGELQVCLAGHRDYVTGLASGDGEGGGGSSQPHLWSCGLGGEVFGWDLEVGRRCVSFAGVDLGQSAYCVASVGDRLGSVGALGGLDGCVCVGTAGRGKNVLVLDGRSEEVVCRLMGHGGTVRKVVVGGDGVVYSGGGDGLIKGWDMRYMQDGVGHHALHTIRCHTDSVWCLQYDVDAGYLYSSGRDGCVYRTDPRENMARLVVDCGDVVTGMCLVKRGGSSVGKARGKGAAATDVWVGLESASSVMRYQIEDEDIVGGQESSARSYAIDCSLSPRKQQSMLQEEAYARNVRPLVRCAMSRDGGGTLGMPIVMEIPGMTTIQSLAPLTDKIHLLAKDRQGNVALWDVTQAREVEWLGKVPDAAAWDELRARMFDPTQSALTWFQPEASLGVVAGQLRPNSCFLCETYTRHLGYPEAPNDEKINVAELMLKTLFANWKRGVLARQGARDGPGGLEAPGALNGTDGDGEASDGANSRTAIFPFAESKDAMVMVSGNQSSLPWKKNCCDMDGTEDVPEWVAACVLKGSYPTSKQLKMSFVLLPKRNSGLPPMGQSSLTAPRVLKVEKMLDYVIKRLKSKGVDCHKKLILYTKGDDEDGVLFTTSPGQVILECDGFPVPSNFTMAAIRQWMWKKPDTLRIEYSVCKGGASIGLPKIKIPEH